MPKNTIVQPVNWGVALGMAQSEDGEQMQIVSHIYSDPATGERFSFPMTRDQSNEFCEVAQAEDPEAKLAELEKRAEAEQKLAVVPGLSEEQIAAAAKASRGDVSDLLRRQ